MFDLTGRGCFFLTGRGGFLFDKYGQQPSGIAVIYIALRYADRAAWQIAHHKLRDELSSLGVGLA
jgi:hypothetical protein